MPPSRLGSEILPVSRLTPSQARGLFTLFSRYYDAVDWPRFEADLREKDYILLLNDLADGTLRGFSTQKILRADVQGTPIRAIFSGDTVIDPEYWGEQELVKGWCRFAGRIRAEEPQTRLFWFLISKGYRTYLYLPVFYHAHYPCFDVPTPSFEKAVLETLAAAKFPDSFDAGSGLLRFPSSRGHLKPELADIPPGRKEDPRVKFFLDKNPDYAGGTELVCLTEISPENMKSLALRMLKEGEAAGALTCSI